MPATCPAFGATESFAVRPLPRLRRGAMEENKALREVLCPADPLQGGQPGLGPWRDRGVGFAPGLVGLPGGQPAALRRDPTRAAVGQLVVTRRKEVPP